MSTGRPACGPGEEMRAMQAGPTVVRMMLGGRLRRLREANGITPADAGWAIRGSHSKINRMETGRSGFKRRDVADLLTLYGVHDETERNGLLMLVEKANTPGWPPRRRPGSAAALRRQLGKLAEITKLPHIKIQVMPFTTGVAAGGAITLLRSAEPEVADVVYLDQFTGALYLDKPADVQHYGQVMDRLCTRAEPPAITPAFLSRLIKEI